MATIETVVLTRNYSKSPFRRDHQIGSSPIILLFVEAAQKIRAFLEPHSRAYPVGVAQFHGMITCCCFMAVIG